MGTEGNGAERQDGQLWEALPPPPAWPVQVERQAETQCTQAASLRAAPGEGDLRCWTQQELILNKPRLLSLSPTPTPAPCVANLKQSKIKAQLCFGAANCRAFIRQLGRHWAGSGPAWILWPGMGWGQGTQDQDAL